MKRLLLIFLLTGIFGCKNKAGKPAVSDGRTYFPTAKYISDQFKLYASQPYPLYRIIQFEGKTDTGIVSFSKLNLTLLESPFIAADISDPKFIGKYEFSEFDESTSGNHSYLYIAKDPDLFNQITAVTIDPENGHVASLYLKNARASHIQQITYVPRSFLQIIDDKPLKGGGARSLRLEYRFLQENNNDETSVQ